MTGFLGKRHDGAFVCGSRGDGQGESGPPGPGGLSCKEKAIADVTW